MFCNQIILLLYRSKSGFLCTSTFVLIYSSSIAISCWFCVLTYAWYISFKALGSTKDVIKDRVTYFHLFSWSITLLLTMLVMLFGVVSCCFEVALFFRVIKGSRALNLCRKVWEICHELRKTQGNTILSSL